VKRPKSVRVTPMKFKGQPGSLIQTPFDAHFVEQLKNMVPWNQRWFVEQRGGWWIAAERADVVIYLAREKFGAIKVKDEGGDEVTIQRNGERCRQEQLRLA
jgi:hypothetical protein